MKVLAAALLALLASGCAQWPGPGCNSGLQAAVQDRLYFGTATPDGVVSAADWQGFVDGVVTPRFPEGLSVWPAAGQWKSAAGPIVREASYVLDLVHAPGAAPEAAIGDIVRIYKARFRQEAVMRVSSPVCIAF